MSCASTCSLNHYAPLLGALVHKISKPSSIMVKPSDMTTQRSIIHRGGSMSEQESSINKNPRILIVDDLPSARKILSKLLQRAGFSNCVQSADGTEALSILEKEKIDIVISDWHMPSMDGLALKSAMDENDSLCDIPFILITSSNELNDVEEALEAGISDYICKPFTLDVINQKIAKYINPSTLDDA